MKQKKHLKPAQREMALLRKQANMTQAEVARRLGVSNRTVSIWEAGNELSETDLNDRLERVRNVLEQAQTSGPLEDLSGYSTMELLLELLRREHKASGTNNVSRESRAARAAMEELYGPSVYSPRRKT